MPRAAEPCRRFRCHKIVWENRDEKEQPVGVNQTRERIITISNDIPPDTPVENALYYNQCYEELSRR